MGALITLVISINILVWILAWKVKDLYKEIRGLKKEIRKCVRINGEPDNSNIWT